MSEIVPKGKQLDKTSKLLDDTLNSLVEGFTGIVASDRKDLILSIAFFKLAIVWVQIAGSPGPLDKNNPS